MTRHIGAFKTSSDYQTRSLENFSKICPEENRICRAFTLAEVLITLGIIGVVASLTMPALIQNSKKAETSARLKKFYSIIQQAIIMSEIDNGNSKDWVKAATQKDEEGDTDYNAQSKVSKEFFMNYLAKYINYTSIIDGKNTIDDDGNKSGENIKIYLADGSSFALNNGSCMDIQYDTNGDKKPNESGRDIFTFYLCFTENSRNDICGSDKKAFCTFNRGGNINNSREEKLSRCKSLPYYCSGLLETDNWEFKDDYPYRL